MVDQDKKSPPRDGNLDAETSLVLPGDEGFDSLAALDGDDEAGLEPDDRQQEEIRQIFGTSFPQYLQPIEEILEQILSGKGDPETHDALSGMLSSLMEASERMGFDNINKLVSRLRMTVSMLDGQDGDPAEQEFEEIIHTTIDELRTQAKEMSGETVAAEETVTVAKKSQTVISALRNKEGVGKLVLKRLSAAGLVTVDQLLMARPDEIAAVAGLDIEIVRNILRHLSPDDGPDETKPSEVDTLHRQILEKLRVEAELEASTESLKAEIRGIRSNTLEYRAVLESMDISAGEKLNAFNTFTEQITDQSRLLDEFSARRNALCRRYTSSEEAVQKKELKLEVLRNERRSLERDTVDLSRNVGGLIDRIQTVRRSFAKRRPIE